MAFGTALKRIILVILGLVFLVAVFLAVGYAYFLVSPAEEGAGTKSFTVQNGLTAKQVAAKLERQGPIRNSASTLNWLTLRQTNH